MRPVATAVALALLAGALPGSVARIRLPSFLQTDSAFAERISTVNVRANGNATNGTNGTDNASWVRVVAYREEQMQQTIDRLNTTLIRSEKTLAAMDSALNSTEVQREIVDLGTRTLASKALVAANKAKIEASSAVINPAVLMPKVNATLAWLNATEPVAKNISTKFGVPPQSAAGAASPLNRTQKIMDTLLVNGSKMKAEFDEVDKIEKTSRLNVSEYIRHIVSMRSDDIFAKVDEGFGAVLSKNTKAMAANQPCIVDPTIKGCNATNGTNTTAQR